MAEITDRISLEVSALQEGFELLIRCKTLEKMAEQFCHLIRGSLGLSFVNLYFRERSGGEFRNLHLQKPTVAPPSIPPSALSKSLTIGKIEMQEAIYYASLLLKDQSRLLVAGGAKLNAATFTEFDKVSVQLFLQLWDHAYQYYLGTKSEKQLVFSLNHRLTQLDRLIESGIELSKLYEKPFLLTRALEQMIVITSASRGIVHITCDGVKNKLISVPHEFNELPSDRTLNEGKAINALITFRNETFLFSIFEKESRKGFIRFEETDQALIYAISRQVLASLENDFYLQQVIEKNRMDMELALASEIQKAILPKAFPHIPGYDIYGLNLPSKEVSGDYFDCFLLGDGRLAMVIADVAGKGFPAALLVSTLHASLHSYLENKIALPDLASKLNSMICRSSTDDRFITFFLALLSVKTGEIEFLNAGHNPILSTTGGQLEKISSGGMALGMLDNSCHWKCGRMTMTPGDRILLYTDGIPEAMNEKEDFFTDEALEKFFTLNEPCSSQEFSRRLIAAIDSFSSNAQQQDDITLLYLKRNLYS